MLSVTVAVRNDLYGVVYAFLLGVLLLAPRRTLLRPVWLLAVVLQGLLILWQYALLLGLPPSILCGRGEP